MRTRSYAEIVLDTFPHTGFFKSTKRITKENESELMESLIYDDDLTQDDIRRFGITRAFPLPVDKYPSVLRSMTASQAGLWAMHKCRDVGWKVDEENVRCCLAQLEMDM